MITILLILATLVILYLMGWALLLRSDRDYNKKLYHGQLAENARVRRNYLILKSEFDKIKKSIITKR